MYLSSTRVQFARVKSVVSRPARRYSGPTINVLFVYSFSPRSATFRNQPPLFFLVILSPEEKKELKSEKEEIEVEREREMESEIMENF